MKWRNALILYSIGICFAVFGWFHRPVLIAGYVVFGILTLIGLSTGIE